MDDLDISIQRPSVVFLRGDLWAWKTTISKYIITHILWYNHEVISPTYTYYNTYNDVYHFDLYRLKNYDEFFAIGGEEIFDNNTWIILVEWPEIIEKQYECDIEIFLHKTWNEEQREIEIIYH